MAQLLCSAVFISVLIVFVSGSRSGLVEAGVPVKRADADVSIASAYQLAVLSTCATGLSLFSFERDYNGYGCHCGYSGAGNPVDATDTCCKNHDSCYLQTLPSTCVTRALWYTIPYKYSKSGCGTNSVSISCKSASRYPWYYVGEDCAEAICKCDRALALCFKDNRATYNSGYRDYNRNNC